MSTARQIGSLGEVLLDQATTKCCVDRLSWHDLSGVRLISGARHELVEYAARC